MTDMRPAFYVSLILLGWAISALADDPIARINNVVTDEVSLRYYAKCFLDKGPCNADGFAFKRLLPNLVATSCAKCSPKNRQTACKIIYTLQQSKYSDLWQDFLKTFDPHGHHRVNLGTFLQNCKEDYHMF